MEKNLNFIWAEDLNGGIGYKGAMPWHLSADLKHFKQVTTGHPVIMGANTMKSIHRPLPGRDNLVLTHQSLIPDIGWIQLTSVDELNQWLVQHPNTDPFVIGGAGVYQQLLPYANKLFRTVILRHYSTDTKMPPIDYDQWRLVDSSDVSADGNSPAARFEEWVRS